MYCKKCGTQLLNNANFCAKCGTKVEVPTTSMNQGSTVTTEQINNSGYAANSMSFADVTKVIQIILTVVLSIFALLHIIAFFLPIEDGVKHSFFNDLQDGEDFGAYWYALLSSTISPLLLLGCFKRERKSVTEKKGVGYIGVLIVSLIIMGIDIAIIYNYKIYFTENYWLTDWKMYRGSGLKLYNVCCVWIPVIVVSKFVLDVIVWLTKNSVKVGWQCTKCGRYNQSHIEVCACGNSKESHK